VNPSQDLGAAVTAADLPTISVGKQADLLSLADDPSRDIRNTRRIVHVMKGGHLTP